MSAPSFTMSSTRPNVVRSTFRTTVETDMPSVRARALQVLVERIGHPRVEHALFPLVAARPPPARRRRARSSIPSCVWTYSIVIHSSSIVTHAASPRGRAGAPGVAIRPGAL
jgi:hypothetical protein